MSDLFDRNSLSGHRVNDIIHHLSIGTPASTIGPNHLEGTKSVHFHGTVDSNLSIRLATPLTSRQQTMHGQLGLHQHIGEPQIRRSNLLVPGGARTLMVCDSHPMQQQNPVNINIFIGDNSSLNINLLNTNPPYQFTNNNTLTASLSGMEPVRRGLLLENSPGILESRHLTESSSRYPFLSAAALTNRVQQIPTRPYQGQVAPSMNLRGNSSSSFFNLLAEHVPNENHCQSPVLSSSMINLPKRTGSGSSGGNHAFHAQDRSQQNLLTHLQSLPATEPIRDQLRHSNSTDNRLPLGNSNGISQAPPSTNITTMPQQNPVQAISPDNRIDLHPQSQGRKQSAEHHNNKYGPYTCPRCHVVFQSGYCYAAHMKIHYRDESPVEQKRRREGKIRKRDLCMVQNASGITIIPAGSLQEEDKLLVPSNVNSEKSNTSNQGEDFAALKVKKEAVNDPMI